MWVPHFSLIYHKNYSNFVIETHQTGNNMCELLFLLFVTQNLSCFINQFYNFVNHKMYVVNPFYSIISLIILTIFLTTKIQSINYLFYLDICSSVIFLSSFSLGSSSRCLFLAVVLFRGWVVTSCRDVH